MSTDLDRTTLDVEWVPIARLRANPANPRKNDEAVPHVAASLKRFGWRQPLVARPDGELIAGHTRLKAAIELGFEDVPVAWFNGSSIEAAAYGIADNRTAEFAEWDDAALAQLLVELRSEDALDGVGFDETEIDALLNELTPDDDTDVDDQGPPELRPTAVSRTGDVWCLGEHRLLAGDSTDKASYDVLLEGAKADLVWTDPPYGVAYVGGTAQALTIQNDELTGDDLQRLLSDALGQAAAACRPGAAWYVAAPAGPNFLEFGHVLRGLGIWRQTLVWEKDQFVLGRSDFHYRHEALFYGWVPGAAHQAPPTRDQDTIWQCDRPKASPDHPTTKPVELVVRAIETSSDRGAVVLDPFAGSGTTIIAAEQAGRRARAIELDPRYCDVAVRRWSEAMGDSARLASTDQTFAEVEAERGGE